MTISLAANAERVCAEIVLNVIPPFVDDSEADCAFGQPVRAHIGHCCTSERCK